MSSTRRRLSLSHVYGTHSVSHLFGRRTRHEIHQRPVLDDEPLSITVGPLDTPTDTGFFVEDDGVGIPRTDRETVFDPGYTTSAFGTGFGLAIVYRIAAAHGWDVAVTTSDAGGARLEFTGVAFDDGG